VALWANFRTSWRCGLKWKCYSFDPPPQSVSPCHQSGSVVASSTHHDVALIPDLNAPIEKLDMEDEVLGNLPSSDK
jgi:hypothetical protein